MSQADYPILQLKKGEERRLRAGHLWVFSNEIDVAVTPLGAFAPGDPVMIVDSRGHALGSGYVNPSTLIAARLVDRHAHALDRSLIVHRLKVALSIRERLHEEPYYRLVFGESDGLPGLVVDRFDDVIVCQASTAGMDRLQDEVTAAIDKLLQPRVLVWKNDAGSRDIEGLPSLVDIAIGSLDRPVRVREGGLEFEIDIVEGQKTGWFYDQHANRDRLARYVKGARVLDLFSYVGAWGLRAAGSGAESVDLVDISPGAVGAIERNIALNGFEGRATAHVSEAFEFLKAARAERRRWDVVILDPPAFVKRKKDLKEGSLAYRRINEAAMQVLERDGILVTASCSHHMPRTALLEGVQAGSRHLDRQAQVLEALHQSPDHPVHPAIPETDYLKGYILRILPA
ncbi:class I SAM-dependent rRNA methyltransferase [Alkalisalibacterium limincola]|uniref:Class I SAM-dependent rRNA methyltransferase n=1 Tax=Alkalisalibacterium limincola TaxID=2699169 RepID=A0A5C8KMW3_9GAMM|nr:class I SAM-dependent rRNA methyltransferase [Alkalisalibacterium limincola]TXK60565.1 class I SAM-dependent rRNA methyltransferase [Alkalisalibacterium limincola]